MNGETEITSTELVSLLEDSIDAVKAFQRRAMMQAFQKRYVMHSASDESDEGDSSTSEDETPNFPPLLDEKLTISESTFEPATFQFSSVL